MVFTDKHNRWPFLTATGQGILHHRVKHVPNLGFLWVSDTDSASCSPYVCGPHYRYGLSNLFKSVMLALNPSLSLNGVRSDLLFFIDLAPGSLGYKVLAATDVFFLCGIVLMSVGFVAIHKCPP